jgi:hypothetical protein
MTRTEQTSRRGVVLVVVAVVVIAAAAAWGVRALWQAAQPHVDTTSCTVGAYDLDPDQAVVASQMVGVVIRRNLPERAAVLVLAAALQESKLRNLPSGSGDRDSVGVLQQRPSQGWGTVAQLSDVRYATGAFLDVLVTKPDWQTRPLAEVVQSVQISADGSAYAQHEPQAQSLADALSGATPAGITCRFGTPTVVAASSTVASELMQDLPVNPPTTTSTSVSAYGAAWATAAWFVANADRLGIDEVSYAGKNWSRSHGWRTKSDVPGTAVTATLHHT